MNILCVRCGQSFSITAAQLGTRGKCPHCAHTILLPKSERAYVRGKRGTRPGSWSIRSLSGSVSIAVHGLILALLLMIPWGRKQPALEPEGTPVSIAPPIRESLTQRTPQWDWSALNQSRLVAPNELLAKLRPPDPSGDWGKMIEGPLTSAVSGDDVADFTRLSSASAIGSDVQEFGKLVEQLKRDGLDIVITFDSTGSMDAEIRQVKSKIERIGSALFKLVPKTRISICTYRDEGDAFVVQGLKLTDNLIRVSEYLDTITAEGGGDTPEAVDQGLRWATEQNAFRPGARKVILLFGDAPPHPAQKKTCLTLAANFRRQERGTVSTVTCHSEQRLADFVEIAAAGGGEAFLSRNDREIMTQLMVLVFGSEHRDKVIEALELLDR